MLKIVADLLVGVHLAYVLFVILGQVAIVIGILLHWQWVRNRWFRWIHLSMISIVAVEAIVQFECPLTTWENGLRDRIWLREHLPTIATTCVASMSAPLGQGPFLAAPLAGATQNTQTSDTFIGRCLDQVLFPGWPQQVLTPIYIGFALLVIATFVFAPPQRRCSAIAQPPAVIS
jgi:hypothetical protein